MSTNPTNVSPLVIPKIVISIEMDQSVLPPRIKCDVQPANSLTHIQLVAVLAQVLGIYAGEAMKYEVQLNNEVIGLRKLIQKQNGGAS